MQKIISCIFLVFIITVHSQNRKFPQSIDYPHCIKPNHITQEKMNSDVYQTYLYWKAKYLVKSGSTPDGYYIEADSVTGGTGETVTCSEAHGFGMVIFALLAGDQNSGDKDAKSIFDGMFYFFIDHPCEVSDALMSWEVLSDGSGGELQQTSSTATDGDLDMAYALLLAHYQWGSDGDIDYLGEAKNVIENGLLKYDVSPISKRTLLGSWDEYSEYQSRPSDWMTAHFQAFYTATDNSVWVDVKNEVYRMATSFINKYSPEAYLISDFVVKKEVEPAPEYFLDEHKETDEYHSNAFRVPMRITCDYLHYENQKSKDWMHNILLWLKEKTDHKPDSIVGGYTLAGEEIRPDRFLAFTAPFVTACIVDSAHQEYLNKGWDLIAGWNSGYYNDIIKLLCMLAISGNWWPPEDIITPTGKSIKKEIRKSTVFNKNGEIYFNLSAIKSPAIVSIYNCSGKELFTMTVRSSSPFIPLNKHLASNGVFVLKIKGCNGVHISEKISIIR